MTWHITTLYSATYIALYQVGCIAKVVVLSACSTVLGMHIACPNAGEIIQGFAVAFRKGLNYQVRYATVQYRTLHHITLYYCRVVKSYEKMSFTSFSKLFNVSISMLIILFTYIITWCA